MPCPHDICARYYSSHWRQLLSCTERILDRWGPRKVCQSINVRRCVVCQLIGTPIQRPSTFRLFRCASRALSFRCSSILRSAGSVSSGRRCATISGTCSWFVEWYWRRIDASDDAFGWIKFSVFLSFARKECDVYVWWVLIKSKAIFLISKTTLYISAATVEFI